jgi:hypothetical protein
MNKERELNSSKIAFKNASQKFSQLETRSTSIDNAASIKTNVNINKERRFSDFSHLKWAKNKDSGNKWQPIVETNGLEFNGSCAGVTQQVFNNNIRRVSLQQQQQHQQSSKNETNLKHRHLFRKYSNESYFGPDLTKKKSSMTLLVPKKNDNFLTAISDSDIHASKENLNLTTNDSTTSTISGETLTAMKINSDDDEVTCDL